MKKIFSLCLLSATFAMPAMAQRIQQDLGRGVVAVNRNPERSITSGTDGKLVSWRRLATESEDTQYNVYQNGSLLATTKNTNLKLSNLNNNDVFRVVPVIDGKELASGIGEFKYTTANQPYSNTFMKIEFEGEICHPDSFDAKYIWPADLDGDGEYDYIVGQVSRYHDKLTDKVQAYKADGTYLWTIDMGPNEWICGGQNDKVLAYDINCDGKAEVMLRTCEGTRFWNKAANNFGLYPFKSSILDIDGDGITDYQDQQKRNPPFYISVVDGLTGEEINSAELDYSKVKDGEDKYSRDNRADYMDDNRGHEYAFMTGHFCITYSDGVHPSLMMECLDRTKKGQKHHNYVFEFKYDWNNGTPSNWHHSYTWSRNDKTPWPAEFHQLRVADVDGDGIDEMLQGGYGVNPKKDMVFSAGIGHGDRYRVSDIDPTRPGLETYAIQQSNLLGQVIYDAATGEHLKEWYLPSVFDVARGECMDVDPDHLGYEVYSMMDNLYDCKGNVIKEGKTSYPYEGIWWDGDLAREVINSPGGSGYSSNVMITKYSGSRLAEFSQESDWNTHAGWAVRPAFMGDIIGDWREEVVLLYNKGGRNLGLVGYTTNIPTDYSFYTLQHDPHYRLDCTTRGYYQSPNTGFYLGYDMPMPPLPAVMKTDLRWNSGAEWANGKSGFTSFDQTSATNYADGKSVVFDISGANTNAIALNTEVKPAATYLMAPVDHDYTISGTGSIGGSGDVWKSERGNVTINANITTTGKTIVSNGVLNVNGTISGNLSLRALGSLGGKTTINGDVELEGSLHNKGCRLMPREVMTFGKSLNIANGKINGLVVETTLGNGKADIIKVNGSLTISKPLTFVIDPTTTDNELLKGEYTLVETTEGITAADGMLKVEGLDGHPYQISIVGKNIVINISGSRDAAQNVQWTGAEGSAWDYSSQNFALNGAATPFVKNDEIIFNDDATVKTVQLDAKMIQSGVVVNTNDAYTFNGEGAISGAGDLVKEGNGKLVMNLKNNDYTGRTIINGGTLSIADILDAGQVCPIGTSTAVADNLQINGGRLEFTGTNSSTNHGMLLTDSARISVVKSNGALALNGTINGKNAVLVKEGAGQLNFCQTTTNPLKAVVLAEGIIAQGDWRMSLGTVPFVVTGKDTRYKFVANNSMKTIPTFANAISIEQGAKLTIDGADRAGLKGSVSGSGSLVLNTGGVRYDISTDMSKFEGSLHINGAARLMSNITDMKKLTLTLGDGASMRHYQGGSSTNVVAALHVGALADAAGYSSFKTKPTFGGSDESWFVGYNNADATFSGKLTTKSVTKMGTGNWTIKGNENTSSITVKEGKLTIFNLSGSATTGTMTIAKGATLAGSGTTNSLVAQAGAIIIPGLSETAVGTIKTNSNAIIQAGASMIINVSATSNSKLNVKGSIFTMAGNDTIVIAPQDGRTFIVGEKLTLFPGTKPASGWIIKSTDGSLWDDSTLAADGSIVCTQATTGISAVDADDDEIVDVLTVDGKVVKNDVKRRNATNGLPHGIYVVGGKVVRR